MCTFNILVSDFQWIFLANFQNTQEVTSHFCLGSTPWETLAVRHRPIWQHEGARSTGKTQVPNQKMPNANMKQQKQKQGLSTKLAILIKMGNQSAWSLGRRGGAEWDIIATNNAWNDVWRGLQLQAEGDWVCIHKQVFIHHMKSLRSVASTHAFRDKTGCSLHGTGESSSGSMLTQGGHRKPDREKGDLGAHVHPHPD